LAIEGAAAMSRVTRVKPLLYSSPDECEQAFYEALEGADVETVVDLWLDDDDVCCVHPGGGRLIGYAAIKASWTTILANGPVRIRATLTKSLDTPTVALRSVVEEVVVTQGRKQQVAHVIATNAYVKTPAGWKMIMHHASPAPSDEVDVISDTPRGPLH
jgi:ketosteroid isomerase-like protein